MPRALLLLAGAVLAVATALAADAPPPVPRDTLPPKLNLEAIPLGLPPRPPAPDGPLTAARVDLGRRLFFDPILSADGTVSCASCHHPDHGFASPEALPRGIRGQRGPRRAPTLFNRAYGTSFFWDGRAPTLEAQALKPIENPVEMGSSVADAIKRLQAEPAYRTRFETAFGEPPSPSTLARALASFERTLLRGDSRVDRFRKLGEHAALTPDERKGLWLFESKGKCWRCHTGPNFTDESFHNTGVGAGRTPADPGRAAVTGRDDDRGQFKTPTLRGVSLTAPYMHDGSLATLEDVVRFYNQGGTPNPRLDPSMTPLSLSDGEIRALVTFLKAL